MLSATEQAEGGKQADLILLRRLMAAKPLLIGDAREIAGTWRCRMIKVGGLLPLTPYGFFNCRITGQGDRAQLEKSSGSQRTAGDLLRLEATTFVYRGVGYTDYVPRRPYGKVEKNDEVGLLFRIGRDHLRLELPAPHYESTNNVMEFVRRR